jgi:hypothetical protein
MPRFVAIGGQTILLRNVNPFTVNGSNKIESSSLTTAHLPPLEKSGFVLLKRHAKPYPSLGIGFAHSLCWRGFLWKPECC